MSTTFKVIGSGQMSMKKNGGYIGTVDKDNPRTLSFIVGDRLELTMTPASGWTFQKLCDFPLTECNSYTYYDFSITDPSIMPQMMIATFIQSGGGGGVVLSSIVITPGAQTTMKYVRISGSGSGGFRITNDGAEIYRNTNFNFSAGDYYQLWEFLLVGTHTLCAEAI